MMGFYGKYILVTLAVTVNRSFYKYSAAREFLLNARSLAR